MLALAAVPARAADPVKGEIRTSTADGYGRLIFVLAKDVDADVRVANGVLVIAFKHPISVVVDRIASEMRDYVGAARLDPDGMAVRLALARRLTVNSMAAGEQLFVDLLPDSWTGPPPSLPQSVVQDLARRAREAEKKVRQQARLAAQKKQPTIHVRVAQQPTFTRYLFEMSQFVTVSADRGRDKLTLLFAAPLKFDLGEALAALPPTIEGIETEGDGDSVAVQFRFVGPVDLRTFRESNNYVLDVMLGEGDRAAGQAPAKPGGVAELLAQSGKGVPAVAAPETVPAKNAADAATAPAVAPAKPAAAPPKAAAPGAPAAPPPAAPAAASATEPKSAPPAAKPAAQAASPLPATPAAATQPAAPPPERAAGAEPRPAASANPPAEPPQSQPESQPQPRAEPTPPAPAKAAAASPRNPNIPVRVELQRQGDNLKLTFPFAVPTPASVFRRADTLWLVFDTPADIELAPLNGEPSRTISSATLTRSGDARVVRIRLARPRLTSLVGEGPDWTIVIGDVALEPTQPLVLQRNIVGPSRASATIPFENPYRLHRLYDPEVGDTLLAVTALGPARGFVKAQEFVEFSALASTHGVVIAPLADDLTVDLAADKIVIARPGGLTLSTSAPGARKNSSLTPSTFDTQLWGFDREGEFTKRQQQLMQAAAEAPADKRTAARLELARFYLARDMAPEAKAVLDVTLADKRPTPEDNIALVLRAVAEIALDRPDDALKDLADPLVGNQHDAPLWRALAYAKQGRWAEAREGFQNVGVGIATLPIELQRRALIAAARASIEVRDFGTAAKMLAEFDTVGVTHEIEPTVAVLTGRLAEGLGRKQDALAAYRAAAGSWDRPRAAQGRLRELVLRYGLGDIDRATMIGDLETLTATWRGDDTEIEALQLLARLYTEEKRYRDAFHVMRTAMRARPNSEMAHRIQDEAAATFDALFLGGQGDAMPPIEALSLFYDFRELTPIGRRGDEMIRRLADRLVSVDLLDQAAELLQHQVDNRLQGAARAQVASRLAVIYLMNRKPDRALATLRATRTADLATELRNQRMLLEGRALADIGRRELALEVIAHVDGPEAIRLRSDIYWGAKRYREAAEQIELLYGNRFKDFEPLNDVERADILRAAIGYALAGDTLGLQRFREKYAAKMADGPDGRAFDVVSAPAVSSPEADAEFRTVVKEIAAVDTLDGFLREMRARYPDTGPVGPAAPPSGGPPPPAATPTATTPASAPPPPVPPAGANGLQSQATPLDQFTTGSLGARASADVGIRE